MKNLGCLLFGHDVDWDDNGFFSFPSYPECKRCGETEDAADWDGWEFFGIFSRYFWKWYFYYHFHPHRQTWQWSEKNAWNSHYNAPWNHKDKNYVLWRNQTFTPKTRQDIDKVYRQHD